MDAPLSDTARSQLGADSFAGSWFMTIGNLPSEEHHVLVALEGEEVQGFAALVPADPVILDDDDPAGIDPDTGRERVAFELTNLDVPERFRDREHEARLLAAATDIAHEHGATEIHMWVIAGNDSQTQFLGGAGFGPRPIRRVAEVDGSEIAEHLWWTLLTEPADSGDSEES